MLTKENLTAALALVPDKALLEAQYDTGYSTVNCKITGVNFNFKDNGDIEMVFCTSEIRKSNPVISNVIEETAA